jgi:hypothetical protein
MKKRGWLLKVCVACLCALCAPLLTTPAEVSAQELTSKDGFASPTNLSLEEMVEKAQGELNKMKGILSTVQTTQEETKDDEKDLVKLGCINKKVSAIKGFLKVSEQSMGKLKVAQEGKNREAGEHLYSLISIASTKVQNLGTEAQACAGEILQYAGDTQVIADIDSDIAQSDPTNLLSELNDLFRIIEVTPYQ